MRNSFAIRSVVSRSCMYSFVMGPREDMVSVGVRCVCVCFIESVKFFKNAIVFVKCLQSTRKV